MDDRILDVNEGSLPVELNIYLEADNNAETKIDEKISYLDEQMANLNNEKEESERSFEERLNKFKEELTKEKELAFENFSQRERNIIEEKDKVVGIKAEEQANRTSYINSLIDISNEYDSKISSVQDAINACGESDTLHKALNEEVDKKSEKLEEAYKVRKINLDNVLMSIGQKSQVVEEPKIEETNTYEEEVNYMPPVEEPTESYENEIVSHEPREDVINDLFQSEEVMEGHVFPFLKSIA